MDQMEAAKERVGNFCSSVRTGSNPGMLILNLPYPNHSATVGQERVLAVGVSEDGFHEIYFGDVKATEIESQLLAQSDSIRVMDHHAAYEYNPDKQTITGNQNTYTVRQLPEQDQKRLEEIVENAMTKSKRPFLSTIAQSQANVRTATKVSAVVSQAVGK